MRKVIAPYHEYVWRPEGLSLLLKEIDPVLGNTCNFLRLSEVAILEPVFRHEPRCVISVVQNVRENLLLVKVRVVKYACELWGPDELKVFACTSDFFVLLVDPLKNHSIEAGFGEDLSVGR